MDSSEKNIIIDDTACDVTVKIDSAELERTMRLSDEELQKAVKQAHLSNKNDTETIKSGVTTSFFTLNKTSSFSAIFEKKRNVEDDLARTADHTAVEEKHIDNATDENIELHSVESSFDIISKIGEGGQGIVCTAADRSLGRVVALKSLHSDLHKKAESRQHFIAEAKITAQLDYPGIVPVYSLNDDKDGGLHLAMKFINGENLADYLERVRAQYKGEGINKFNEAHSMRKRIEIFLRSCDAIAYAHSRNVMHCDLKPENIMLGQHNDSYIMDWGIARLIQDPSYDPETWSRPAVISGTPRYLAPESINGIYPDERIDIYALGLILFECVFLKCAYNGKDTKEVIAKVRNGEMESFTHAFNVPVNKDLCAVIRKAVASDRDKRYQSVNELTDDIRAYLANEETTARPDKFFTKIFRFGQRHIKMLLIFALTGLLLAGASVSFSVIQRNKQVNFILQREIALSEAYSRALNVSGLIELQMNHVEKYLKSLSVYASYLLTQDKLYVGNEKKYFCYQDEIAKKEHASDIRFSEPCNKYISLERLSFNHSSGEYTPQMIEQMERLQEFQGVLKKTLLYGNIFREKYAISQIDEKEAVEYFFKNGSPILWFYCGFENGLYFSMPGYLEHPENYDPRKRPWYKAVENKTPFDDVVWSVPYMDAVSKRLTLTASIPIFVNQKRIGVLAIDNMLQYIARFMKNHGNTEAFLLEKVILDDNGRILLSTREDYSVRKDDEKDAESYQALRFFGNSRTFKVIRRRQNGILSVKTPQGRRIVYLFSRIDTHDWYYVEKIDLDMLIDHIAEQQKRMGAD